MMQSNRLTTQAFTAIGVSLLLTTMATAQVVPATLPKPDTKPPATDKPVKVYILSGQSNSLGFGRANGGSPTWPSIYLSPDPTIKTGMMPVGSSGLMPMRIYPAATGDERGANAKVIPGAYDPKTGVVKTNAVAETQTVALGDVSKKLPSTSGPHTVMVTGFVEVPITGMHHVHVGFGDSEYAIAKINGKEVYRKVDDGNATITKVKLEQGKRHALSIIYLKGGNATFWMELVDLKPKGTLAYHINEHGRYTTFVDDKGEWNTRKDVIICDAYMGKGKSQPLGAMWRGGSFGPELGFGYVMGTFHDEPVIVMKADIGNRSLAWDCLPPGSERYQVGDTMYAGYGDGQSKWPVAQGEPKKGGWYAGKQYDDYTASIHNVLNNFDEKFPQFAEQGYEIAGFVWWQGHKDQNPVHASRYEHNLKNLIKAWRKEFNAPNARFAIATIAFGGWKLDGPGKTIAEAQLAVGNYDKYPAHKGNVATIEARDFWRDPGESPKNQGYHYNHNGETYFLVGDALGRAMVEMMGGKAEQRQLPPRKPQPDTWPDNPTLAEAAEMIYSDPFISKWSKHPAEPSAADYAKMAPALQPIILGDLVPSYAASAAGVPNYRRHGGSLVPIITGEPPTNASARLLSQLDLLLSYYEAAGVHDYSWKKFGPDMQNATWHYTTFDPPEKLEHGKPRYRKTTYPKGSENWFAADFDPVEAGWKKGQAPFAQNNGQLKAMRSGCGNPQCDCAIEPKTLWDKEVLLMRQTFKIPPLDDDHRYRLVVGGSSHGWAGEAFEIYVNGKLFAVSDNGNYKKGENRGGYIYNDFKPAFDSGEVTISIRAFMRYSGHRNKAAPPRNQISVWMESMKVPRVVIDNLPKDK